MIIFHDDTAKPDMTTASVFDTFKGIKAEEFVSTEKERTFWDNLFEKKIPFLQMKTRISCQKSLTGPVMILSLTFL